MFVKSLFCRDPRERRNNYISGLKQKKGAAFYSSALFEAIVVVAIASDAAAAILTGAASP